MKTDIFTKILLLVIALFLGIISFRPLIQTEIAQASAGDFDHVKFIGIITSNIVLMDNRNGNLWVYKVGDPGVVKAKFLGRLIELGKPLANEKK
ncbi:hypothetical protein FJZ40_03365 [Candidatus Shapirobacteria bacterium]|nr:hypothetical protein [Candidatus Shapirobacteria bacterium]